MTPLVPGAGFGTVSPTDMHTDEVDTPPSSLTELEDVQELAHNLLDSDLPGPICDAQAAVAQPGQLCAGGSNHASSAAMPSFPLPATSQARCA